MNKKPLVSILMNCYNGEKYLKEAIDSIYAQTYTNWEIVFVDNCSTDKSEKIAKSYDGERLKYYKTERNIPLYAARNFGLNYISGDYLGFLDTDDIWMPIKLELQVSYVIENEIDFICTGSYNMINDKSNIILSTLPNHKINFIKMLERYEINIQTVMLAVSKINLIKFDDRINIAGDYDFFLKYLHQRNINAYFLENVTVYYRIHDNNLSKVSWELWEKELTYIYQNIEPLCTEYEKYRLHMHWDKRKYRALMKNNSYSEARDVIRNYLKEGFKEKIMYLITFLPIFKILILPKGWQ
jgi:glycosyltransferase involved in cell wall biosynthesis